MRESNPTVGWETDKSVGRGDETTDSGEFSRRDTYNKLRRQITE